MKKRNLFTGLTCFLALTFLTIACEQKSEKKDETEEKPETTEQAPAGNKLDKKIEEGKGIGPVDEVELSAEVDQEMAAKGKEVFEQMCTACHKVDKRYIGPAIQGVTERRKPEWIMNMILNPEVMVRKDPTAKALLAEYSAPMANQNLSREQARQILEYFRSIDKK